MITLDFSSAGTAGENGLTFAWPAAPHGQVNVQVTVVASAPKESSYHGCDATWRVSVQAPAGVEVLNGVTLRAVAGSLPNPSFFKGNDPTKPLPESYWIGLATVPISGGLIQATLNNLPVPTYLARGY